MNSGQTEGTLKVQAH